ncbi:MAG: pantoate--beta-alanine ligase [Candidatus Carbobacillus altaicus]|nr:pantoate--beta-alanine ligase [Candidatus Carbobacillus altaicus]
MLWIRSKSSLKEHVQGFRRQGKSIGLVPTMGYLHEGHEKLMQVARRENDVVVLSIFVNPTQFGPQEDFAAYPRDLARDRRVAEKSGVDLVFQPDKEEMYPTPLEVTVEAGRMETVLCGRSRPGHFRGVLTVVSKLFHLVEPDRAYFGQKDGQQLALIQKMVEDLDFPVEIVPVETVREEDGLAKSSRNVYLTEEERRVAPELYRALSWGKAHWQDALYTSDPARLVHEVEKRLQAVPLFRIDYVELVTYPDLKAVTELREDQTFMLAAAIYLGKARLIDNVLFGGVSERNR